MATTYTDSFNRSGTIAPGSTETGGGTWAYTGSGTASANGASAVLNLAGGFLYLDVGFGDVDVAAVLQSRGEVTIRASGTDQRRIRARMESRTETSGGYVSAPQYVGRYIHNMCENTDSYTTQCNNNSFPNVVYGECYNGKQFVQMTKYLTSVTQSGTCSVYQSSSYTVTTLTFEAVAADGTVTNIASRQVNYTTKVRLVASSTTVQCYADDTLVATATDGDATRRANGRHGITGSAVADSFSLTVLNTAPDAPLLVTPVAGASVDRTIPVPFSWQFSDADATDVQSKADVEFTVPGMANPVTFSVSTDTSIAIPPNALTFPEGASVSWRVRTYDAQGVVGPWSNSSTFVGRTPPATPVLSTPSAGGTIPTQEFTVAWIAPAQEAFEVRRTADVANPSSAQVYQLVSGQTAARSAGLSFAVNGRAERVWVRVRSGGLWSAWASASVTVSYTPPAQPSVRATPDPSTASIDVDVTCPVPTGTQPAAVRFDLFRTAVRGDLGGLAAEERVLADAVPVQGSPVTWTDWTPASGIVYSYRAKVYGANGTASSS